MTEKDLAISTRLIIDWARGMKPRRIVLVNPDQMQRLLIEAVFPDAIVDCVQYPGSCDLGKGPPGQGQYDLAYVANTLMCSTDPGLWIRNLLQAAEVVWIQELIRARRGGHQELDPLTGDRCRFSVSALGELARVEGAYDLSECQFSEIVAVRMYKDDPAPGGYDTLKFMASLRKKPPLRSTKAGRPRDVIITP